MYCTLSFLSKFFQFLPRKLALALGRYLGSFIYYVYPRRKSIAMKNLEIAFPEYEHAEKSVPIHARAAKVYNALLKKHDVSES